MKIKLAYVRHLELVYIDILNVVNIDDSTVYIPILQMGNTEGKKTV